MALGSGSNAWLTCQPHPHQTGVITSTTMGFGLASPVSVLAGDSSSVTHSLLAGAVGKTQPQDKSQPSRLELGAKPSSSSPAFAPADVQGSLPTTLMLSNLPFLPFPFPVQHRGWMEQCCGPGWGLAAVTPPEMFSYFGAHVIPALKITHAQQICRWSKGHQNQPSAACELIPDASLGDLHCKHCPHITQNGDHMEGLIAC